MRAILAQFCAIILRRLLLYRYESTGYGYEIYQIATTMEYSDGRGNCVNVGHRFSHFSVLHAEIREVRRY